eukprot:4985165-Amphidinium_carterae.1
MALIAIGFNSKAKAEMDCMSEHLGLQQMRRMCRGHEPRPRPSTRPGTRMSPGSCLQVYTIIPLFDGVSE